MKIAVTGKGGAGKTTVAAIMARSIARSGHSVVAVDADPNPNLGISLGLGPEETSKLDGIVNILLRERAAHDLAHAQEHPDDHDHDHNACEPPAHKSVEQIIDEMAVTAPDGVWLVQTGRIERPAEGCLCCGSHGTTRKIFAEIDAGARVVVADLEAGVSDLMWAKPTAADTVVVVTEPYRKSLEVARRAVAVSRELGVERVFVVANRIENADDMAQVRAALPGAEIFEVPDDVAIANADRSGTAPMDSSGPSPAVRALTAFAARLVA